MILNEIKFNWMVNDNLNKWKFIYNWIEEKIMLIIYNIL